jgi:hypothetical protein
MLAPIAITYTAQTPGEVEHLINTLPLTAVITDPATLAIATKPAVQQGVPIVLLAEDAGDAAIAAPGETAGVLLETDPAVLAKLISTLHTLAGGAQRLAWSSLKTMEPFRHTPAPLRIVE